MKNSTFLKGLASLILLVALAGTQSSAQPNLWATSANGFEVSSFTVNNGTWINGPTNVFNPAYPGSTTGGGPTTAALGKNSPGNIAGPSYFYYLPNSVNNAGVVEVYAALANGGSNTRIGSLDLNGDPDPSSLGFVRLGMGPDGTGWILASSGTRLYLARFMSNGLNLVTIIVEDDDVTLTGGTPATFLNGDLCVTGNGRIFALANNGSGVTQIYTGNPAGAATNLVKKWDLFDANGPGPGDDTPFAGTVNGVAFDVAGSLYISTAEGLFFINQATVNGPGGQVFCTPVRDVLGLQDLASSVFPNQTTLPVDLISFSGSLRNNITTLNWESDNEVNFDHYEIQRSGNGVDFTSVGNKASNHSNSRSSYQHADNLTAVTGAAFQYRLKIVDINGSFKYSNVILVRKDQNNLTGITLNPNPVVKGMATARFFSSANTMVSFRVLDMSGRVILTQQNTITEGANSVSINNLDRLQPGAYVLQVDDNGVVLTTKFSVNR